MSKLAKLIEESELGSLRKPDRDPAPIRRDGMTLIITAYEWGRAYLVDDPKHTRQAAWLETEGGQQVGDRPDWTDRIYNISIRPDCLGWHEPDLICDGGINEDGKVEEPCAWRGRCKALQRMAAGDAARIAELNDSMSDADLERLENVKPRSERNGGRKGLPTSSLPLAVKAGVGRENLRRLLSRVAELGDAKFVENRLRATEGDFYFYEANGGGLGQGQIEAVAFWFLNGKHWPILRATLTVNTRLELASKDVGFVEKMLPDLIVRQTSVHRDKKVSIMYLTDNNVDAIAQCIRAMLDTGRIATGQRLFHR